MNYIEKIIKILYYVAILMLITGPLYSKPMTIIITYIIFWIILFSYNTYVYRNHKDRFNSKDFKISFIVAPIIPLLGLIVGILVGLYKLNI